MVAKTGQLVLICDGYRIEYTEHTVRAVERAVTGVDCNRLLNQMINYYSNVVEIKEYLNFKTNFSKYLFSANKAFVGTMDANASTKVNRFQIRTTADTNTEGAVIPTNIRLRIELKRKPFKENYFSYQSLFNFWSQMISSHNCFESNIDCNEIVCDFDSQSTDCDRCDGSFPTTRSGSVQRRGKVFVGHSVFAESIN